MKQLRCVNKMSTLNICKDKKYEFPKSMFSYYSFIKNKRILDVGCGTGNLCAYLREQNNECYGITISQEEAAAAQNKMKEVIVSDVETMNKLPFDEKYFDVIIMGDILEHLKNPLSVLMKVKGYLKNNGMLIVSIPNVANIKVRFKLLMGKFEYEKIGILDETHLRFFTKKTSHVLMVNAGFKIIKMDYTIFDWPIPKMVYKMIAFREWEIRNRLTKLWPELLANQFMYYAEPL